MPLGDPPGASLRVWPHLQRHLVRDLSGQVLARMLLFGPSDDVRMARVRVAVGVESEISLEKRLSTGGSPRFHPGLVTVHVRGANGPKISGGYARRPIDRGLLPNPPVSEINWLGQKTLVPHSSRQGDKMARVPQEPSDRFRRLDGGC